MVSLMKLSRYDLDNINYWNNFVYSEDNKVYDIIVLNYSIHNLILKFKFERFKSFCFHRVFALETPAFRPGRKARSLCGCGFTRIMAYF